MKHKTLGILAVSLIATVPLCASPLSRAFERMEHGMQQMMDEVNNLFYSYATPIVQHKRALYLNNDRDSVTLLIDMPNLEKDDIKAERSQDKVTISVNKPEQSLNLSIQSERAEYSFKEELVEEELDDKGDVVSRRSSARNQSQIIVLPSEVSLDEVSVHYEDGRLSITLPKLKKEPDQTRIPVTIK